VVLATVHTHRTEAVYKEDDKLPLVPTVVVAVSVMMLWPARCEIFQPPAPKPAISNSSPTAEAAGNVKTTSAALFAK
jgi:hypothetical protein